MSPKVKARGLTAARWLGWWAATFALYLALVDTRQHPELVLGAAVAATAATAALALRASAPLPSLPVTTVVRHLPHALVRLVAETWTVFRIAFARLRGAAVRGRIVAVPFRAGGDGARDVARRALSEALGSMGPNQIVLGVDADRDLLIVHQLAPDDERADPLDLG